MQCSGPEIDQFTMLNSRCGERKMQTHINNPFDGSQHSRDRWPNKRDLGEEAALPDDDVQQLLVHFDKEAESVRDGRGLGARKLGLRGGPHGCYVASGGGDDVTEAEDDLLFVWSLCERLFRLLDIGRLEKETKTNRPRPQTKEKLGSVQNAELLCRLNQVL